MESNYAIASIGRLVMGKTLTFVGYLDYFSVPCPVYDVPPSTCLCLRAYPSIGPRTDGLDLIRKQTSLMLSERPLGLNAKPQADTLRLIENKLDYLMLCSNVPLENGSSSTRIAHMKPDILAVAKSFVGIETSDGKQILPRIVLEAIPFGLSEKEGEGENKISSSALGCQGSCKAHRIIYDCHTPLHVANLPHQLFDISLSLPRPVASSYTTPIESSYAALSSIWDNIVLAYEPVWATRTGKVASPEQAQEVS
ncbi:ABC transporter I family member 10-like protein [Tanacetum coccineum]